MAKGLIRLSYRKIIDVSSQKTWDTYVFDDTYQEFYMQAQSYNQDRKYSTFQELLTHVPEADKLHYLTSRAAISYIRQLKGIIPNIVNTSEKLCLPFTQFKFEIIQSHVQDKALHTVAISFFSEPLTWIDTLGNTLLIAYGDQRQALQSGQEVETDLLALQPFLTIAFLQNESLA